MNLRISLLSLVGLTALIAFELATLKTDNVAAFICIEIVVHCLLFVTSWGAFLQVGKVRRFSMGYSVIGWAFIFGTVFTNLESNDYYKSELAKLAAETISQGLESVNSTNGVNTPSDHYFKLWFLWSMFNFSLLGGLSALRINPMTVSKEPVAPV